MRRYIQLWLCCKYRVVICATVVLLLLTQYSLFYVTCDFVTIDSLVILLVVSYRSDNNVISYHYLIFSMVNIHSYI